VVVIYNGTIGTWLVDGALNVLIHFQNYGVETIAKLAYGEKSGDHFWL